MIDSDNKLGFLRKADFRFFVSRSCGYQALFRRAMRNGTGGCE